MAVPEFNLPLTLESGQVFHWLPCGVGWTGLIDRTPVYVAQSGDFLEVTAGTEALVSHYFSLDHPLDRIYGTFPKDPAMKEALAFCRGLRVIRQPPWECLATFITSALKQVKHIQQMSHAIRTSFGDPITSDFAGEILCAYPSPEQLAAVAEEDLRACRLGFRAKSLCGTARMIADGTVNLDHVATLDDASAVEELRRLPGVGDKIANCVLLFGFQRLKAFPIDVWIGRVLREIYFKKKRNVTPERLQQFSQTYFGPYGGYAQQYLFHHARRTWKRAALRSS